MQANLTEVLSFLTNAFNEGRSYSSINIFRSMLSYTLRLGPSGLAELGKHPLVVKLMKGIYNSRPPTLRYSTTWDPELVLKFFKSVREPPSLLQLAGKTSTLLALTTLLRGGEIASIKLDSIKISPATASFTLAKYKESSAVRGASDYLGFSLAGGQINLPGGMSE